ncbi:metal-dependent transcriptional regulator [Deinococcus cellulosilyticus]|uniref:Manganese transport regulator n=1 Tax=Deinococcus cellulosilyticus (strain DSM 18568 / NBRC 106333 / KACC 11606 / 5516J-15) TaxID=1223518 RepID=A0A511N199_DEIC1|nr:metal-dependent transcriptional regulator [Deinococcus cellulosilyticus]GEM46660.1 hypothetical protein DC3_22950 [Deinococcus cellulosilyticus NBRC 106333 = KACC 11606]
MRHQDLTPSTQDYLKHLLDLGEQVTPGRLAQHLQVKPPSVTGKLRHLQQQGLIQHTPYHTITLTETGRTLAQNIQRHHQLLTLYLHQVLGYSIEDAKREAETLEHHISEKLEDRLYALLGQPTEDLTGHPIQQRSSTP